MASILAEHKSALTKLIESAKKEIIIMAGMAVFFMLLASGYLIEERRRWPVILLPREDNVLNKFRILNESHVHMRKPYQSNGKMKNSSYYNCPGRDWTHDLPHTVASNMVKVSHALTSRPLRRLCQTFSAYQEEQTCVDWRLVGIHRRMRTHIGA